MDPAGGSHILLVPLHVGLHISWRNQLDLVTKPDQFTRPVMRCCTCFHANQTGRLAFKERQHLPPPQLALHNNVAGLIDAVHLEHVPRDVQTNRANLLHGLLLLGGSSDETANLAHRDAGGGAVQSINSGRQLSSRAP
jgi:hypothetical protein